VAAPNPTTNSNAADAGVRSRDAHDATLTNSQGSGAQPVEAGSSSDALPASGLPDASLGRPDVTPAVLALPTLTLTLDKTLARRWASIPDVASVTHVRVRGDVAYVSASPEPLRVDVAALGYRRLGRPRDAAQQAQDIVAPAGSARLVAVFASTAGATTIRLSNDDGASWLDAVPNAMPDDVASAVPASLASLPDTNLRPGRTFMTYGGTTLDVSDDGGLTWSRAVIGAAVAAQGFAIDTAGTRLWCVAEAALDRVAAFSLAIAQQGALAKDWSRVSLSDWDSNGVYSAEPDPLDPHGIYIGGEGRIGYLGGSTASAALRWNVAPDQPSYSYVLAIMTANARAGVVVFGGGEQGAAGAARVFQSSDGGVTATAIPLEGEPRGKVRGITQVGNKLLFFVETGSTLDVYAIES
jgi:hypothetical protein